MARWNTHYVPLSEATKYPDVIITVHGWVEVVRNQKKMQFLIFWDDTAKAQAFNVRGNNRLEVEQALLELTPHSTVSIVGKVILNPSVKLNGFEIEIHSIEVHSIAEALPISPETAFDQKMDYRWIDLRSPQNQLMMRVQTTIEAAMRLFWKKYGFVEIHSPKLTGTASESGAELFSLPYFGRTAYLAQSPQFYKQMAMASALNRVFEIGPVFRANPSFTSRHDTEFTSVDVEVSWIQDHHDLMDLEERWIQFFLQRVADEHGQEIHDLFGQEVVVPTIPFPRIDLSDAVEILKFRGHIVPPDTKGDLDPTGERILAQHIQEVYGHQWVFVVGYPASVRAFYHMRPEDNQASTKSFDLLFKGIEVTTGAQREHRYEILRAQALEKGLKAESIQFYLDFFRYGMPPHGGFGFGLTRLLMKLLGLENVRQVTYVYRGPNRLNP